MIQSRQMELERINQGIGLDMKNEDLFMYDLTSEGTRKANFSPKVQAFPEMSSIFLFQSSIGSFISDDDSATSQDDKDSQHVIQETTENVASYVEDLFVRQTRDLQESLEHVSQSSQRNEEALDRISSNLQHITRILQERRHL